MTLSPAGAAPALSDGYPRPFGSYVLLTAFAHGGMGEVYLAKTGGIEGIERICVLKKLRPDFGTNQEYVNRFLDEARLVVQLNHANIAHVFDVGRVGGEYYLAMEYVSGVSLKGLMARAFERGAPLPPPVALYVLCEALEALDYAHRLEHPVTGQPLNLVHRDISPHNVMVSYEGEVKLIDFGLAESELKEEQTESQVVMGKVAYMSPEQARGERVTGRCDQFAAGVMAYELLAHDRFYGEMTNYQIWQVVGRGGFTPRRWGALDPALQPILSRALHGDPSKRFESCGDFKEALLDWLVARSPKTSRRTVREHVRALFEGDTERERTFLQQVSSVSAASVRAAQSHVESTQSYSIVRAPGSNPPGPAPGVPQLEPKPAEPARGAERSLDASSTHVVERRPRGGGRGALAASLGVVVVGVVVGFLLMRSTATAEGESPGAGRTQEVAPTQHAPTEQAAAGAPTSDEEPTASATDPASDLRAADDDGHENASAADKPDDEPVAIEQAPVLERKQPRQRKAQKRRASTPAQAPVKEARAVTHAGEAVAPTSSTAEPKRSDEETSESGGASGAQRAQAEAWRTRVVRRLERCEPCAKTFLERAKLRTLPAARLTDEVRLSVETCLKQCEAP